MQVKEVGSGASERKLREKLLKAARRREIDVAWSGGWTAGDGPWQIWWPHFKNSAISGWALCR